MLCFMRDYFIKKRIKKFGEREIKGLSLQPLSGDSDRRVKEEVGEERLKKLWKKFGLKEE